jgi:hypothetical protein
MSTRKKAPTFATIRARIMSEQDLSHYTVVVTWFIAAVALGIPGLAMSVTGAIVAAVGASITVGLVVSAVLIARHARVQWSMSLWTSIVALCILAGSAATVFGGARVLDPNSSSLGNELWTEQFALTLVATVWLRNCLLWALFATLVAARRRYSIVRARLVRTLRRVREHPIDSATLAERQEALRAWLATVQADADALLARVVERPSDVSRNDVATWLATIARDGVSDALSVLDNSWISTTEAPAELASRSVMAQRRPLLRFNGRYFSGFVGGLVIGVAAMLAATTAVVEQPGFLLQIPLIVAAFALSPASASMLLFAAALTPIVADGPSPEEFLPAILILAVAGLSAGHRLYEVRRLRALEELVLILARESLDGAISTQRRVVWAQRAFDVIHGKIQGSFVATAMAVSRPNENLASRLESLIEILRLATDEIDRPLEPVDFAAALEEVVTLWHGSVSLAVTTTISADRVIQADPALASIVLAVIGESTLNAAKHGNASSVAVSIVTETRRIVIRARATSAASTGHPLLGAAHPSGRGLAYLSELTSVLRLESDPDGTTLHAEVPVEFTDGASPRP